MSHHPHRCALNFLACRKFSTSHLQHSIWSYNIPLAVRRMRSFFIGVSSKFGAIVAVRCRLYRRAASEFYDDRGSNLRRTPRLRYSCPTRPHADATPLTRFPHRRTSSTKDHASKACSLSDALQTIVFFATPLPYLAAACSSSIKIIPKLDAILRETTCNAISNMDTRGAAQRREAKGFAQT